MSLFSFFIVSACSISIPIIASVLRWDWLKFQYLPLVLLLVLGGINEVISYINIYAKRQNTVNANMYVLVELIIIIWLFRKIHGTYSNKFLKTMVIMGISVWLADNMIINSISSNNSLFRMVASLIIVVLSIDKINQLLFSGRQLKLNNTDLLISCGFLINFSYKTFVEAFNIFPMPINRNIFYRDLWVVLGSINILTNLLFTAAILCKDQKQEFSLHLSQG